MTDIVIMAGGIGSRLWPLSTPETPKQFIDLLGVGKPLIRLTVERFLPLCGFDHIWVVTSKAYVETVKAQIPEMPQDQILAEPEPRNTAPCIAYAAWKVSKKYPGSVMVVTPSDAAVIETGVFRDTVSAALQTARDTDAVITLGIPPSRPDTGYGYICASSTERGEIVDVREFKEKPDLATAKSYLESGNYFWNAGIFIWSAATAVSAIRRYAPGIAGIMDGLAPSFCTPGEQAAVDARFGQCEKISIDYAVMERYHNVKVISADFGWSDLGTWKSVGEYLPSAEGGNAVAGQDVRLFDCKDCIVDSDSGQTIVLQGLEGYIVAASGGRILVCRKENEQHIKEYSQKLSK